MSEEQTKNAVRNFLKSLEEGDVAKSLSFLTQDVAWASPHGTFKGSIEVQKYITWMKQTAKNFKIIETGIGILVQGNTAIIEHNLTATTNGKRWEIPSMCVYQFKDEKIQNMRSFYDILSQAKQVVGGGIPKWMVNTVIKASVKGLR